MEKKPQNSKVGIPATKTEEPGRNLGETGSGAGEPTARRGNSCPQIDNLMEVVVESRNMKDAYDRVVGNKGAAGIDGMTVEDLKAHLNRNWQGIKKELLAGRYQPQAVMQAEIPKPNGGMRKLGIPTVVDRMIQQAIHQVLEPHYDPYFSESSFGFRKGRSTHQALTRSMEYIGEGRNWVVDIDLEKFFDSVNHDILMSRLARRVKDKRLLGLIRKYLQSGIMVDGTVTQRVEGTPQGSPLSPLLSNILLDDLDKELERRGHAFCRYADDCNIYVYSRRAGERVMESLSRFLDAKLRLRVNKEKSKVDRPWKLKFLGYSTTTDKPGRLKPAPQAVDRLKEKLKEEFRKGRGRSVAQVIRNINPVLRGWINYFRLAGVRDIFQELDGWIRRKLRCIIWRHWKRPHTRMINLKKRGLDQETAWRSANNGHGPWWNAGARHMNRAFPKKYFEVCGLISLLDKRLSFGEVS